MIKLVAKKNSETDEIINLYSSVKEAAASVNTTGPYISQALRLHGNSRGYKWEYVTIDDTKIIELFE